MSRSYYEQRRKLGADWQKPGTPSQDLVPPDARLGNYQAINQMKVAGSFNELALRWDHLTPDQKRVHVTLLLKLFSNPVQDVAEAMKEWRELAQRQDIKGSVTASALQIVNPTTGKGANRAKANGLAIGNQDSFWLLELLKFFGFMEGAASLTVQDEEDRKTFTFLPRLIKFSMLEGMMKEFRTVFRSTTAVKLDILASLRFAQVFVHHYKTLFEQEIALPPWMPRDIVSLASGFDVAFYKHLGSAHATMNISTIGWPAWLRRLENLEQVEVAEAILDDQIQLIRLLRNSKGEEGAEEYELLHLYRDFLSGHDLNPFWEFTSLYSAYLMSAREKNRFVYIFTVQGLENLLMNNHSASLKAICEQEGFKHVANAIRQSTITAQYRRTQLGDRRYDTRYGLGQDLKRKAHRPAEFMEALGIFLQQYSEETEREEEKLSARLQRKLTPEDRHANNLRSNISEDDLKEIASLIDQYGSELICSMLIAFGYAQRSLKEDV
ncbi:MAG: hypothetical protein H0U76_05725 [Ktedonobacteraceae bacterium]|nr:hypothetical protein [Ktedonobacteraceae bacterium]